jgi:hypothetical protein
MINFLKKYFKSHIWISLGFVLIVLLAVLSFIGSFANNNKKVINFFTSPVVVSRVEPLPNMTNVGPAPDIVIYFGSTVSADDISLRTSPALTFEKIKKDKDKLLFRPLKSLKANQDYDISVLNQKDVAFVWKIKTKSYNVADDYAAKVNKAKATLPYKSANVIFSYDPPTDKYFAYISGLPLSKYLPEVTNWFATFGITDTSPLSINSVYVKKWN